MDPPIFPSESTLIDTNYYPLPATAAALDYVLLRGRSLGYYYVRRGGLPPMSPSCVSTSVQMSVGVIPATTNKLTGDYAFMAVTPTGSNLGIRFLGTARIAEFGEVIQR